LQRRFRKRELGSLPRTKPGPFVVPPGLRVEIGLGLVAIGAGAGAGPSGGGTSVSRFAVFDRPSGPVDYVLVDEHGHAIARSGRMPEVSVAGAVATAVQRGGSNSYRVELRSAPDAPARVVARANGPPELAFSDDGTALAVTTGRHILIVSVPAGTRRTLPLGPGSYSAPAFSPDGRLLAFVRSTGGGCAGTYRADLQVVPITGGPAVTVFREPHPCSSQPVPVFTADGKRLAFVVDENELVTVPVGGGTLVLVAPTLENVLIQGVIPLPDGSGYVVTLRPQYGVSDVWQVDNAGVWNRLTVTPIPPRGRASENAGTYAVTLAPDGGQLLIESGSSLETYSFREQRLTALGTLPAGESRGVWPPTAVPADGGSGWPSISATAARSPSLRAPRTWSAATTTASTTSSSATRLADDGAGQRLVGGRAGERPQRSRSLDQRRRPRGRVHLAGNEPRRGRRRERRRRRRLPPRSRLGDDSTPERGRPGPPDRRRELRGRAQS
jgi:hypothetical protein